MTKNSPGAIRPLPKPGHGSNSGPDGVDLIVQEPVLASTNLDRCTSSRPVLRLLAQMGRAIASKHHRRPWNLVDRTPSHHGAVMPREPMGGGLPSISLSCTPLESVLDTRHRESYQTATTALMQRKDCNIACFTYSRDQFWVH